LSSNGIKYPRRNHGEHEISTTIAIGPEDAIETDLAGSADGSGHMAMR
jgi:hypothetical protein